MNLTIRQKKFADLYLKYGNATKAAIEAGYSPKSAGYNADKLLKNIKIRSYIDERLSEIEDKRIADVEEVMQYLTKGLRQELDEEVILIEGCGDGVSEAVTKKKKISIKDSNKCAELLAKRFGILTDKLDISGAVPVVIANDDNLED